MRVHSLHYKNCCLYIKKLPGTVPIFLPIVTGRMIAFTAEMTVSSVHAVVSDFLVTTIGVDALTVTHTQIDRPRYIISAQP